MRRLLPILLSAFLAFPAFAQPAVQSPDAALAQDAGEYARAYGVAPDEALRRLRAQDASVAITDGLRREFRDRLAGIAIEHRPDFAIRVTLTGSAPVADRLDGAIPVRFRTGAAATGEQVVAAMRGRRAAIEAVIGHQGMGYDARTGGLLVMADPGALGGRSVAEIERRLALAAGVPARLRVLGGEAADSAGIGGGGRLEGDNPADGRRYFCTSGFVVTDGARSGIVTAAHCPDVASYVDAAGARVPLEFVGGWGGFFQDVQVHVASQAQAPVFRADAAPRPLQGQRQRARTRAGEFVCHRGEASGYSCAEVELTDYIPPGALCGGPCDASWVAVAGPSCRGGDSGGPVFLGTTAFGILKGANYAPDGRCNFYYYMSTDYLPPGWSLLLADGSARGDINR